MDIKSFQNLAATANIGRVTSDDEGNAVASSRTKLGKTLSLVGDFFARFTPSGSRSQANANQEIRSSFVQALKSEFGTKADGVADKLTSAKESTKPLMARDVRKIMSELELGKKIDSVRIDLPGGGQVGISRSMLPASTASALSLNELQQGLQAKVDNGAQIVAQLRAGGDNLPTRPSQSDVADVMWFLQLNAESKAGQSFKAGAITLTDPGGNIKAWLDSSTEAYQRKSSHIGDFAKMDGGTHRGIDMAPAGPTDLDDLLPNGRATILYGGIGQNTDLQMPKEMLFIKLESHGCRLAGPSDKQRDENGPQGRPIKLGHDLKHFIGHSLSFLSGIGARASGDHGAESRKERINKTEINAFKELLKPAEGWDAAKLPDKWMEVLNQGDPTSKSAGIRVMLNNVAELKSQLETRILSLDTEEQWDEILLDDVPEEKPRLGEDDFSVAVDLGDTQIGRAEIESFIDKLEHFQQTIAQKYGRELDTLSLRIGNEVILGDADF